MAARTITIHGLAVEIWQYSFRIEGMSNAIYLKGIPDVESVATQLIEAIHGPISQQAEIHAKERLSAKIAAVITKL